MPPKGKKKKGTKVLVVGGDVQEVLGNALLNKMGRASEASEYGSEYQETPRSELDESYTQSMESSRKEEEDFKFNQEIKQSNIEVYNDNNYNSKTSTTIEDSATKEESKYGSGNGRKGSTGDQNNDKVVSQQDLMEEIQHMKDDKLKEIEGKGALSQQSVLSVQATVDESGVDDIDEGSIKTNNEEEERARKLEDERERLASELELYEKDLSNIDKRLTKEFIDDKIKFETIEQKLNVLRDLNVDLLKINVSKDLIKPEYRDQLSDLVDEVKDILKMKATLQQHLDTNKAKIDALQKQKENEEKEEDEALKETESLKQSGHYENALKALDRVNTHRLQEKFKQMSEIEVLIQKKEQEEKDKQDEEEKRRQHDELMKKKEQDEEQKRKQQELDEKKRKDEEEHLRKLKDEEYRKKQQAEADRKKKEDEDKQKQLREAQDKIQKEEAERKKQQTEAQEKKLKLAQEQEKLKKDQELKHQQDELAAYLKKQEDEKQKQLLQERTRKQSQQEEEKTTQLVDNKVLIQKQPEDVPILTGQPVENDNEQSSSSSKKNKTKKDNDGGGGGTALLLLLLGVAAVGGFVGYKMLLLKK